MNQGYSYTIKLRGVPRRLHRYARNMVHHCVTELVKCKMLHQRTAEVLEEFEITFNEPFVGDENDHIARCDIDCGEHKKPRRFVIEFNPALKHASTRGFLITLAHEMTHAAQFASGRLISEHREDGLYCVWEGKRVDEKTLPYWYLPWELEAQAFETSLYCTFAEKNPELNALIPCFVVEPEKEQELLEAAKKQLEAGVRPDEIKAAFFANGHMASVSTFINPNFAGSELQLPAPPPPPTVPGEWRLQAAAREKNLAESTT